MGSNRVAGPTTAFGSSPKAIDLDESSNIDGLAFPKAPLRHCASIPRHRAFKCQSARKSKRPTHQSDRHPHAASMPTHCAGCPSSLPSFGPLVAGDSPPRQDRFRLSRTDTETPLARETEFTQLITNYKVRHIITTYTDIQLCAQLNHKCNVNVSPYKNPRTRPYSIQIMQWHDRWRPHASQWPKPAYHHSPLTESARPEHEPIPKSELTISPESLKRNKRMSR